MIFKLLLQTLEASLQAHLLYHASMFWKIGMSIVGISTSIHEEFQKHDGAPFGTEHMAYLNRFDVAYQR